MWWTTVLLLLTASSLLASSCRLEPTPYQSRYSKIPGDNGYQINIIGDHEKYVPGEVYSVYLRGSRSYENLQFFSRFLLRVESATNSRTQNVGMFQLFRDSFSRFHEDCINTIREVSDLDKTEVYVMWTAPPAGSGCVNFKAMVMTDSAHWYSEDGQLTKTFCERTDKDLKHDPENCCACDEAKYSFIFEGLWTNITHPKDFPTSLWLTHFSDVIGASHVRNFSFWGENHYATDGFRSLAEWGSPRLLESELKAKSRYLRNIVKAPGLWYPNVNGNTTASFRVDRKRHLVSLVSMLGPSPDWVVGVSGLNLCLKNCSWMENLNVDLYPWDAGTDSGITYMSPNAETNPRETMYRITTMYPEDPRAPFYDPTKKEMLPLARIYFTREKIVPKGCDEEFLASQVDLEVTEDTEDISKPECAVTEFSDWSSCSVSCGKGLRMRSRDYRSPQKALTANCKRQLVFKEMCVADVPECGQPSETDNSNEELENTEAVCRTTEWKPWSECSVTCGIGFTMRTRTFLDRAGRKKCPHIITVEKDKCMLPPCQNSELPDPMCPVTEWSDWSPCSVTCGPGIQIRKRILLVDDFLKAKCGMRIELDQRKNCMELPSCTINPDSALDVCMLPREPGPCYGSFNRYYYDSNTQKCEVFGYGGCRGNRNNFVTEEECENACGILKKMATTENAILQVQDCVTTPWSEWSPCNVSCGRGVSVSTRKVKIPSQNGGVACPPRMIKRRKCNSRIPCQ